MQWQAIGGSTSGETHMLNQAETCSPEMSTWTWSRWASYLGERNFRLPAIFGFTRVPGFWHIPHYRSYSSICCRVFQAAETPDRKLSKGIIPSNQRRYTNSSVLLYEHQFGDVNPVICGCIQLLLYFQVLSMLQMEVVLFFLTTPRHIWGY